ncbi:hypothetical protein [Granulicatella adiacens]|uniref:hypothetical protein n=1 Tax=Granulicatella adiacens TaxID=46124 RepID=UPI003C71F35A
MEDKKQYEAFMEELKKLANNFIDVVTELGDILEKILPDVEIPDEEEEDTWEMKCPYKDGNKTWVIYSYGDVDSSFWFHSSEDNSRFQSGNIFPTKEAAELEAKRRKILTRFRAFRDECNGDWKVNWNNAEPKHFLLFDNFFSEEFKIDCAFHCTSFRLFGYFKNKKDAERAIELFGDEIKELFVECE